MSASMRFLYFVIAPLSVLIFVLHSFAMLFSLYWSVWWYDIVLHGIGGIFVSLLLLWLFFFSGYLPFGSQASFFKVFLIAVLGTLIVGIGWEIFELIVKNTWSPEGYWLDTTIDIFMDIAGSLAGFIFFKRFYAKYWR